MAYNAPLQGNLNLFEDFEFTYKDVAIGGKLVRGTIHVPDHKMVAINSDHEFKQYFKTKMATQLAEYMISNGLVEFTQIRDHTPFDTIVYARCYLAPNDQIKILRTHYGL